MSRALSLRALALALLAPPTLADLGVVAFGPARNVQTVDPRASITIDFDRAIDPATLPPSASSIAVFGSSGGPVPGAFALENAATRVRFVPARAFAAGELVRVSVTRALAGQDGEHLRRSGVAWTFRCSTRPSPMHFTLADEHELRTSPSTAVRVYGANACDLDLDGWIDLAVVCEDSSDVRVLLNRADATCRVTPYLVPTSPSAATPSPSECADFDGDGVLDLATAAVTGDAVSIFLGNGDGTFAPRVDRAVPAVPRGLAAFDADGDGDLVAACVVGDQLVLLRNAGDGTLGAPQPFESGAVGEQGLAAADMDEDGILDLVVGARFGQRVVVMRGLGNGTFAAVSSTPCGGLVWQVALGDLDGDGHLDVTTSNATSNTAAVLFGDGHGGLSAATIHTVPPYATATDLGDLDGDGDLDWIVSCHGGGVWRLLANDGAGAFTPVHDFAAPSNPACASPADLDRDGDLDLVLLDEVVDRALVWRNDEGPATSACSGDGTLAACPCGNEGGLGRGCAHSASAVGALLEATGDVASDTVALAATDVPATALVLFVAADAFEQPTPLGDGLGCVGGSLRRFGAQAALGGSALFPGTFASTLSQASGTTPGSGALGVYQAYYRNSAAFCTSAAFNMTNARVLVW